MHGGEGVVEGWAVGGTPKPTECPSLTRGLVFVEAGEASPSQATPSAPPCPSQLRCRQQGQRWHPHHSQRALATRCFSSLFIQHRPSRSSPSTYPASLPHQPAASPYPVCPPAPHPEHSQSLPSAPRAHALHVPHPARGLTCPDGAGTWSSGCPPHPPAAAAGSRCWWQ